MDPDEIIDSLVNKYPDIKVIYAWGETSLFYNPNLRLPRGIYFATIKQKNGENDRASDLDREGIFRLSTGTSKEIFFEAFGQPPPRPSKGCTVKGDWDFTAIDQLMPHPVYGWMSWVAVNNPSVKTFNDLNPVIDAAYKKVILSYRKR